MTRRSPSSRKHLQPKHKPAPAVSLSPKQGPDQLSRRKTFDCWRLARVSMISYETHKFFKRKIFSNLYHLSIDPPPPCIFSFSLCLFFPTIAKLSGDRRCYVTSKFSVGRKTERDRKDSNYDCFRVKRCCVAERTQANFDPRSFHFPQALKFISLLKKFQRSRK